ncbi:hypothetical protein RJ641_019146 [Dillenia turbinata]|uniref:Uncharacterized protein n=1 Tax=Dillenia turbinata TaxID=194707 RepID=A0AAN8UIX6_9MAGN
MASRSSSPVSIRPNPKSRTPETINPTRRSFSGNPFARPSIVANPRSFNPHTPANSPADYQRRNSIGKEGSAFSFLDHEKENDLKSARVRSPSASKGQKNFMSPTISASSKISAASPKKKILADRNGSVRVSVATITPEGNSQIASPNPILLSEDSDMKKSRTGSNQKKTVKFVDSVLVESEGFSSVEISDMKSSISEEPRKIETIPDDLLLNSMISEDFDKNPLIDSNNIDSRSNVVPVSSSPSPMLVPLDADPSLPPYDPKTNYLSPRPQFLHYKPNPRIEVLLNRRLSAEGGKRLEDSFLYESFSDGETLEESAFEDSQKEADESSSSSLVQTDTATSEDEETQKAEPKPNSTVEAKRVSNSKPSFSKSNLIFLFFILSLACLSISFIGSPPVINNSMFKDLNVVKAHFSHEILAFGKAKINEAAQNLRHWSDNSISYLSKMVSIWKETGKVDPLYLGNVTASEELSVDGYSPSIYTERGREKLCGNVGFEFMSGVEYEVEGLEEKDLPHTEADEKMIEAIDEQGQATLKSEAIDQEDPAVELNQEISNRELNMGLNEFIGVQVEDVSVSDSQASDNPVPQASDSWEVEGENEIRSPEIEDVQNEPNPLTSESDFPFENSQDLQPTHGLLEKAIADKTLMGISVSLVVLGLIIAATTRYLKREKDNMNSSVSVQKPVIKKCTSSPGLDSEEHTYQQKLSSRTVVDMLGESCPSEMSSFQRSSSYTNRDHGATSEVRSQERKARKNARRESLSSSSDYSMGSPSYGSFTTYEIIHNKNGSKEEAVTPVRRSSRLRNQVLTWIGL